MLRWYPQYDPWRDVRALQRQMDDVFRALLPERDRGGLQTYAGVPAFNVTDTGQAFVVEAELPGFKREDLSIDATSHSLTVKGQRNATAPEGQTLHRQERGNLRFARSFSFDARLDLEKVAATLQDGILRVEVGKHAESQPRRIAIKA